MFNVTKHPDAVVKVFSPPSYRVPGEYAQNERSQLVREDCVGSVISPTFIREMTIL